MQQSIESYTYRKNPPVDEAGMYVYWFGCFHFLSSSSSSIRCGMVPKTSSLVRSNTFGEKVSLAISNGAGIMGHLTSFFSIPFQLTSKPFLKKKSKLHLADYSTILHYLHYTEKYC